MEPILPLASTTWDDKEIEAACNVIRSQNTTGGEIVKEFEERFADFVGSKYCVMVNSGSSANLIAVASTKYYQSYNQTNRIKTVLVPALSWGTTYFPWYQNNINLFIGDINIATLNIDCENVITENPFYTYDAMMPVHILGNPTNMSRLINDINEHNDPIIIEDCCEALGATINGRHVGTFGLAGTFSFFFSHHISTMEGGAIVTNDGLFYDIMKSIRSHGWIRDIHGFRNFAVDDFTRNYTFLFPGYNVRATEVQAAIGIEQLKKLPGILKTRRENAEYFLNLMHSARHPMIRDNIIFQQVDDDADSSWFGFSMVLKHNFTRKGENLRQKIVNELKSYGIESRPILSGSILEHPVAREMDFCFFSNESPNAKMVHDNGFYIGNSHQNISIQLKLAAAIIERTLENER